MSAVNPTVTLPPLERHDDEEWVGIQSVPRAWHLEPTSTWTSIWGRFDASKIKIGICDTGIDRDHPEIKDRILGVRSFVPGEGYFDKNQHGTHVAGTVAGENIGVCRGAGLVIAKCLSDRGSGASSWILSSIRWLLESGCDIINLSLGGRGAYQPYADIGREAAQAGCLLVAAAGNSGGTNTVGYPARYSEFLAVANHQQNGAIAPSSSGGRQVAITAPGSRIVSCVPGNRYAAFTGTSMASPFVAGTAGVQKAIAVAEGSEWAKSPDDYLRINENFIKDSGPPGKDVKFGHGILDVAEMTKSLVGSQEVA